MGANVKGYSLKPEKKSLFNEIGLKKKMYSILGDIRNYKKLNYEINNFKPEIIFHLAAQPLVLESYKDPLTTFQTNIMGTINLIESIKLNKFIKSSIIVTTDKCYRNNENKKKFVESDTLGGKDPYSWSKVCTEYIVKQYKENYFDKSKKSISTVRSGNVIGSGDYGKDRIIPDIIKSINNNKVILIRNPKSTRPWQDVLDALFGYIILAEKQYNNSTFSGAWNFGPNNNKAISVKQIVDTFIKLISYKKKYKIIKKKFEKESKYLMLNSNKSKLLLNWKTKININLSLKNIILWNSLKDSKSKKIYINDLIDDYINNNY